MKCFEVQTSRVFHGLPVHTFEGGSLIGVKNDEKISGKEWIVRALFSPALEKEVELATRGGIFPKPGRVNQCSIDRRSEVWLMPEVADDRNHTLVLWWMSYTFSQHEQVLIELDTGSAELLAEGHFSHQKTSTLYTGCRAVLFKLLPDQHFLLKFVRKTPSWRVFGKRFQRRAWDYTLTGRFNGAPTVSVKHLKPIMDY